VICELRPWQRPDYGPDAQLIAAAPDLLDAVEELLIYLADWNDPDNETCQRARAAVAKAKGESR